MGRMDGMNDGGAFRGPLSLQASFHCTLDDRNTKGDRENTNPKLGWSILLSIFLGLLLLLWLL